MATICVFCQLRNALCVFSSFFFLSEIVYTRESISIMTNKKNYMVVQCALYIVASASFHAKSSIHNKTCLILSKKEENWQWQQLHVPHYIYVYVISLIIEIQKTLVLSSNNNRTASWAKCTS